MKPTDREMTAVHHLADALIEFLLAYEIGHANRWEKPDLEQRLAPPPQPGGDFSQRKLLNSKQATTYLGIGVRTLWTMTAPRGPIPVVRIGNRVCYSIEDLDQFVRDARIMPYKRK